MFLGFIKFSGEEGPRGAGTVHLVEDRGSGAEHPVSVAEVRRDVERERDRPLSEFAPTSRSEGPTGLDPDAGPVAVSRVEMRERRQ